MKPNFSFLYNGEKLVSDKSLVLDGSVEVSLQRVDYPEFDAVKWVLYFENKSDKDSGIISDICDCDTAFPLDMPEPKPAGYRPTEENVAVITMKGMVDGRYYWENDKVSATEYGLTREYLDKAPKNTKSFANTGARSSEGMLPFFDVTANGEGYITAIGWTGDWKASFTKEDVGVRMKSGLKYTSFYLKPGEKIRTSSTLVMRYEKGEDKYNKFRALIRDHFSHKACTAAERESIFACELWGGLPSDEMAKRLRELKAHDIKFRDVWIDAAWYGNCLNCESAFNNEWSKKTGEWDINPNAHPDGFKDVVAAADEAGMNLMLWIEPERAVKGTKVHAAHPDWFITRPDNDSAILNYGNPEAWKYVRNMIVGYVKSLKLSVYRQDFNTPLTDYFAFADEENRRGITEIKHIMGMYELWDAIHEEAPELLIDNCSGGGRRIDIETLSRAIPFFRSDYQCNFNENSEVLQAHNANISRYLPYNGCTSKTKGDTYAIRSAYSSSFGGAFYNAIFQTMSEEDFAWAKKYTDEYLGIRDYFSKDFYNHGADCFDESSWAIFQYHDKASDSGIVMAFRRVKSPFDSVKIKLDGIKDNSSYTVKNLNTDDTFTIADTLEITLPEKRSSVIFEYKK